MITPDSQYLLTADYYGYLKQWSVKNLELYKDYGKVHQGAIWSMAITSNGKYLFTAGGMYQKGFLKQWDLFKKELKKDYGLISKSEIYSIALAPDQDCLYTTGEEGRLLKILIEEERVIEDFVIEKLSDDSSDKIVNIGVTFDGQYLFVNNDNGCLRQISLLDFGKSVNTYEMMHDSVIEAIVITN